MNRRYVEAAICATFYGTQIADHCLEATSILAFVGTPGIGFTALLLGRPGTTRFAVRERGQEQTSAATG